MPHHVDILCYSHRLRRRVVFAAHSSQACDKEASRRVLCIKDVDYAVVGLMCVHDRYGKSKRGHYAYFY